MRLFITIAVATTGLIWAVDGHAQMGETGAAAQAWTGCLQRAASADDDHKSAAGAIAAAIVPKCAKEHADMDAVFGKIVQDPDRRQKVLEQIDAEQIQQATSVVEKERQTMGAAKSN